MILKRKKNVKISKLEKKNFKNQFLYHFFFLFCLPHWKTSHQPLFISFVLWISFKQYFHFLSIQNMYIHIDFWMCHYNFFSFWYFHIYCFYCKWISLTIVQDQRVFRSKQYYKNEDAHEEGKDSVSEIHSMNYIYNTWYLYQ